MRRSLRPSVRGFTLAELLVVMGILAILGVLTAITVQRVTRDSRVASATNTVLNLLQTARAQAIRDNKVTAVVFRPAWDPSNRQRPQQTELVVAQWTGESIVFASTGTPGQNDIADRFLPVAGIKPVRLPVGVKVAGPLYEDGADNVWATQGEMPLIMQGCKEAITYSRMVAVMFAPDGSLVARNPLSSAGDSKTFVDFNRVDLTPGDGDPQDVTVGACANTDFERFWMQDDINDETNLTLVPFLAVYDDRAAREIKALDWAQDSDMLVELTGPAGFITTNSDRIHFNRYSGVAEVTGR
jgi:prepilin-type N-terminal cleavage/methylation domain-containing protein